MSVAIWPVMKSSESMKTITRSGFGEVGEDEIRRVCEQILDDRKRNGNGG